MTTRLKNQQVRAVITRTSVLGLLVLIIGVIVAGNRLPFDLTTDPSVSVCILLLAVFGLAGIVVGVEVARQSGRALNFRSLLIWSYVAVGPLSGIVHLLLLPGDQRGYFDALTEAAPGALAIATIATTGGLVALCIGALAVPIEVRHLDLEIPAIPARLVAIVVAATTLVLLIGVYSASVIRAYVASTGADRIIALDTGLARFSYFSNWLVWAISLTALVYYGRRVPVSRLHSVVVLSVAVVLIVASLNWTGGRSIIAVMAFPLVLVSLPRVHGYRAAFIGMAAFAGIAYIAVLTTIRTGGTSLRGSSLLDFVDWQWGRFSMTVWASSYTAEHGLLWGQTFLASGSSFLFGASRLIGFPIQNLLVLGASQVAGRDLLHSTTQIYIVPGLGAELIMNFGMAGVILGMAALGVFCGWIDSLYVRQTNAIRALLFAYIGSILVFRTLTADSGSPLAYLFYTGAPLIVLALIPDGNKRRGAQVQPVQPIPSAKGSNSGVA